MPKKKKPEPVALKWWQLLAYIAYYVIVVGILWAVGFLLLPDPIKDAICTFLQKGVDGYFSWLGQVKSAFFHLILLVVTALAVPFGVFQMAKLIYCWFRGRECFTIPSFGPLLNLPPWPNKFYDEFYVERQNKKSLRTRAKAADRLEKRLEKSEEENGKLRDVLDRQVKEIESLMNGNEQHTKAMHELYRLMENVSALLISQNEQIDLEFSSILKEVAHVLTMVTTDGRNDKSCSIMMVNNQEETLCIIESIGLGRGSNRRTFKKGQGFAGWIWENGVADAVGDVSEDYRFRQEGCSPSGLYRSIVGVPIKGARGEFLGALFVQSPRANSFDKVGDVAVLEHFSRLLSICISGYNRLRREETDQTA